MMNKQGFMSALPNSMVRGITLNNQHLDLFEIIEDDKRTEAEKTQDLIKYLKNIESIEKRGSLSSGTYVKLCFDYTAKKLGLTEEESSRLFETLQNDILAIFSRRKFINNLRSDGFENPELINDTIMEATDIIINRAKEGISNFLVKDSNGEIDATKTMDKVKSFHEYVLSSENGEPRFNRINFDDIASPTCFLAIQNDYIRSKKLEKAIEFCKKHDKQGKINSAFFYMHSHYPTNPVLKTREDLLNYYQIYFDQITEFIGDSPVKSFDIFNEFVYRDQPQIISENGEVQYSERHNGFHALLSVEDICGIVKSNRDKISGIEFLYNDDGFDKAEKREGIFREIEKIQALEDYEGQLINGIGMQFHTGINIDISQVRKAVIEAKNRFPNLNINITELDIDKRMNGFNYEASSIEEMEAVKRLANFKQKQIMQEFIKLADEGLIDEVTLWSQSDEMAFRGRDAEASVVNYNSNTGFSDKSFEYTNEELLNYSQDIEIVSRNILINLIKNNNIRDEKGIRKLLENFMPEVKEYFEKNINEFLKLQKENYKNPVQDFNMHTHTMRCGHADSFAEDFEYVNEAVASGISVIAFTDHIPFPKGYPIEVGGRMQYEELEDYLASINYLKQSYDGVIQVKSGFEFEYVQEFEAHLADLKEKSDLMILGQHFVDVDGKRISIEHGDKVSDKALELYADSIVTAIEKGLPNIIAHPDLFLRNREFGKKEEEISRRICKAAKEAGIPLEINMGELYKKSANINPNLSLEEKTKEILNKTKTPSRDFWKIASDYGCKVVYGKDAHYPRQISDEKSLILAKMMLGENLINSLNFVTITDFLDNPNLSKKDFESLALSPEIELDNTTIEGLIHGQNEKSTQK